MADIATADIKALRDETGVSVMACKQALEEAGGDREQARVILRRQSGVSAAKKAGRALGAGVIVAYVHNTGSVAALVHLACETDFVAKNGEFAALAREMAMQVAALAPRVVSREEGEDGEAYTADEVLVEQAYIKNPERTIRDVLESATQKFGERIAIAAMSRLSVN